MLITEKTLILLNQMVTDKVIERYAIGGAIAAAFYIEPTQTYDLDVFLVFPMPKSGLISISPIYSYLMQRGYQPEGESIKIEGWPVQFLPVFNPLTEEALANAVEVTLGVTKTYVFSAEYLAAIMLFTGRPKDHIRLIQFFETEVLEQAKLMDIIARHSLTAKWHTFQRRFLNKSE
ncbi:MAG: hypothetical protein U0350_14390 [Caldilineaceae bacterium]